MVTIAGPEQFFMKAIVLIIIINVRPTAFMHFRILPVQLTASTWKLSLVAVSIII